MDFAEKLSKETIKGVHIITYMWTVYPALLWFSSTMFSNWNRITSCIFSSTLSLNTNVLKRPKLVFAFTKEPQPFVDHCAVVQVLQIDNGDNWQWGNMSGRAALKKCPPLWLLPPNTTLSAHNVGKNYSFYFFFTN